MGIVSKPSKHSILTALFRKICVFIFFCFSPLLAESKIISSYGELYTASVDVAYPKNIQELQSLVTKARANKQKITIVGGGLSQGMQSVLEHSLLIDMRHLKKLSLDGHTLTAEGGAFWDDIQAFINPHGLALQTMQGSNIFSVGGSLSVNCHGWDFRAGSIANTIQELTIIDPKGNLLTLTPSDPLFHNVIGGYGCFGIIVEVKMTLTQNVSILETAEEISLDQYVEYFHTKVKSKPEVLMHRYRLSVQSKDFLQSGLASNYTRTKKEGIVSPLKIDQTTENLLSNSLFFIRKFPFTKDIMFSFGRTHLLKPKHTSRNEVMSPPAQFHFSKQTSTADWLQEFFIEEDQLVECVHHLRKTLQQYNVHLLNATVRYVKKETSGPPLSYTKDKNQFAIVLYFVQKLSPRHIEKTQHWVQEIIEYVREHNGTYYLPYHHFATREQFQACYPNWERFKKEKEEFDPDLLFLNGFYQEYFQLESTADRGSAP